MLLKEPLNSPVEIIDIDSKVSIENTDQYQLPNKGPNKTNIEKTNENKNNNVQSKDIQNKKPKLNRQSDFQEIKLKGKLYQDKLNILIDNEKALKSIGINKIDLVITKHIDTITDSTSNTTNSNSTIIKDTNTTTKNINKEQELIKDKSTHKKKWQQVNESIKQQKKKDNDNTNLSKVVTQAQSKKQSENKDTKNHLEEIIEKNEIESEPFDIQTIQDCLGMVYANGKNNTENGIWKIQYKHDKEIDGTDNAEKQQIAIFKDGISEEQYENTDITKSEKKSQTAIGIDVVSTNCDSIYMQYLSGLYLVLKDNKNIRNEKNLQLVDNKFLEYASKNGLNEYKILVPSLKTNTNIINAYKKELDLIKSVSQSILKDSEEEELLLLCSDIYVDRHNTEYIHMSRMDNEHKKLYGNNLDMMNIAKSTTQIYKILEKLNKSNTNNNENKEQIKTLQKQIKEITLQIKKNKDRIVNSHISERTITMMNLQFLLKNTLSKIYKVDNSPLFLTDEMLGLIEEIKNLIEENNHNKQIVDTYTIFKPIQTKISEALSKAESTHTAYSYNGKNIERLTSLNNSMNECIEIFNNKKQNIKKTIHLNTYIEANKGFDGKTSQNVHSYIGKSMKDSNINKELDSNKKNNKNKKKSIVMAFSKSNSNKLVKNTDRKYKNKKTNNNYTKERRCTLA